MLMVTCHPKYLVMRLMTSPSIPRPGRPKTNPLSRLEQVRVAKRTQRERERERASGIAVVPVKLDLRDAERLRVAMQQPEFAAQFALLLEALERVRADVLAQSQCFFGGGTRIALALGEYRESADIDFLCASRTGYRTLRASVTQRSLGIMARWWRMLPDVRRPK